jgi:hypothetical protein
MAGAGVGSGMQKETAAVPMEGRLQARTGRRETKGTMSGFSAQMYTIVYRCTKINIKKTARSWILTRWIFMLASFYEKALQETSVVLTRKSTKKVKSVKSTTNMGNCAVFGRMPGRIFGPQDLATFG